ncbi:MAG TPA: hypothetical protein DCE42_13175 [Myxococcales bacterium]|nr:hypothetical protein [Deltaproteobacteria bacterium]MBU51708.1 hypothetical protein [Deltaproteobacteria bacterium]HAA55708.1 hypothetical protein [Myxococcales bacterium]|tara:strand:+ start:23815 stop:26076 length:2262 start_codon:yes stop_codon:yes gene_type:complete
MRFVFPCTKGHTPIGTGEVLIDQTEGERLPKAFCVRNASMVWESMFLLGRFENNWPGISWRPHAEQGYKQAQLTRVGSSANLTTLLATLYAQTAETTHLHHVDEIWASGTLSPSTPELFLSPVAEIETKLRYFYEQCKGKKSVFFAPIGNFAEVDQLRQDLPDFRDIRFTPSMDTLPLHDGPTVVWVGCEKEACLAFLDWYIRYETPTQTTSSTWTSPQQLMWMAVTLALLLVIGVLWDRYDRLQKRMERVQDVARRERDAHTQTKIWMKRMQGVLSELSGTIKKQKAHDARRRKELKHLWRRAKTLESSLQRFVQKRRLVPRRQWRRARKQKPLQAKHSRKSTKVALRAVKRRPAPTKRRIVVAKVPIRVAPSVERPKERAVQPREKGTRPAIVSKDPRRLIPLPPLNKMNSPRCQARRRKALRFQSFYIRSRRSYASRRRLEVAVPAVIRGMRWESLKQLESSPHWNQSQGIVKSVFSPDSQHIVTIDETPNARIWHAKSGRLLHLLKGHKKPLSTVAISHDGRYVATGSFDRTIRLWKRKTGALHAVLKGHKGALLTLSFLQDGKTLVSAAKDQYIYRWDLKTGALLSKLRARWSWAISASFNRDGTQLVTTGLDDHARIWNAETGQLHALVKGHTQRVTSASFSFDGKMLITSSFDQTVRLWKTKDGSALGKPLRSYRKGFQYVTLSSDATYAIATSGRRVSLWDICDGKHLATFMGKAHKVYAAAFSQDSQFLVTGDSLGNIRLYRSY